jgi:hypothetical protein
MTKNVKLEKSDQYLCHPNDKFKTKCTCTNAGSRWQGAGGRLQEAGGREQEAGGREQVYLE